MAEVTSGDSLTVIVMDDSETDALVYLLNNVNLAGTDSDNIALNNAYSVLDALGVEVTV